MIVRLLEVVCEFQFRKCITLWWFVFLGSWMCLGWKPLEMLFSILPVELLIINYDLMKKFCIIRNAMIVFDSMCIKRIPSCQEHYFPDFLIALVCSVWIYVVV